jgi:hypothetical protein
MSARGPAPARIERQQIWRERASPATAELSQHSQTPGSARMTGARSWIGRVSSGRVRDPGGSSPRRSAAAGPADAIPQSP